MIARLLSAALVLVIFGSSLLWSDLRNSPGHWPIFFVGERGIISSEFRIAIVSASPISTKGHFVELRALAAARREWRGIFECAGPIVLGAIAILIGFGASLVFGGGIWWLD